MVKDIFSNTLKLNCYPEPVQNWSSYKCFSYERRKGTTTTTTTTAQPASSESEQTHSDESLETHDDGLEDLSKDSPSEDSEASATVSMPGSNGSELENVGMRNELNAKDGSVSSLDSRTSDGNPSASLESNKKSAEEGNPIVIDVNSKKTFGDLNFEDKMSSPELQDDQESIRVGRRLPPSADLPWLSVKLEINMEKPGSKEPGKYLSGSSEDEIESGTNTEQSLVPYGKEDTLAAGTDDDVQSTQSSDTLEKSLHTKNDQGEEMGGSPAEKTHEISEESSKSNQDNVTEEESNGSSATENSDVLEGCSEVSNDE